MLSRVLLVACAALAAAKGADLVTLPQDAGNESPAALDGSPYAFYWAPDNTTAAWTISIDGARAARPLGGVSSTAPPRRRPEGTAIGDLAEARPAQAAVGATTRICA